MKQWWWWVNVKVWTPLVHSPFIARKEINIILNNRIFSMILHLEIISHSHHHHHHHLYSILCIAPCLKTPQMNEHGTSNDVVTMILRHDEPLKFYVLLNVQEDDYLQHAHLFITRSNKWFLVQNPHTHKNIFTLIFNVDVTLLPTISRTFIVRVQYNVSLHILNSIQFLSHLGNLLYMERKTAALKL